MFEYMVFIKSLVKRIYFAGSHCVSLIPLTPTPIPPDPVFCSVNKKAKAIKSAMTRCFA